MHLGRIELKLTSPPPPPSSTAGGLAVVGAHGGAGASTLAATLGPSARDLGTIHPGLAVTANEPLILAARGTVAAARHATDAVRVLHENGVSVAVLAVIGDGLPEPQDATARFVLLEGLVGGVVRVPFLTALRLVDDPTRAVLSPRAQRALNQILALAAEQASHA
ncbi:hypothetical protein GCM10009678_66310 [Actinomadura kijaniata]|uniref:Uncharacterized protein n=1 Tax=Actinomadura namibiensis TaxID=182080 RepID=A0A7W3QRM6_ACTNM|nr:hypothetical protein [Actinomadura namibiensis]MBA8956533.1 hypothetical protein [Actinomadura namibiensis]